MTRPVPPAALRRLAPTLLAACLCAALPATAQTAASAPVELHLPAGPLQASLTALARQSGIQLLFAADSVSGRSAPAVDGRYTRVRPCSGCWQAKAWRCRNVRQGCSW